MNEMVVDAISRDSGDSNMGRKVLAIAALWFVAVLVVALADGFNAPVGERPLAILLAISAPVILFGIGYMMSEAFRDWVLSLDLRHLVLLHSWRMVGMGFVFLYFHDLLPGLFALPAGLGDVMAALGALLLGIALYEEAANVSNRRIFLWNTFGLLDFILAVSLGVMTRTGEVLQIGQTNSDAVGLFPLVLIPGFAVPFYLITHLIIYAQLKRR